VIESIGSSVVKFEVVPSIGEGHCCWNSVGASAGWDGSNHTVELNTAYPRGDDAVHTKKVIGYHGQLRRHKG